MKTTLLSVPFLVCSLACSAQLPNFHRGQIDIQVGTAFAPIIAPPTNENQTTRTTYDTKFSNPSLVATVDYGITDDISIGAYIARAKAEFSFEDELAETSKLTLVGLRGLYHVDLLPTMDIYAGAMFAYGGYTSQVPFFDEVEESTGSHLYYQATLGAGYRFANTIGAFAEVGYGFKLLNIGLNLKLSKPTK